VPEKFSHEVVFLPVSKGEGGVNFLDLIIKKRHGGRLSTSEIDYFISHYVRDMVPDYQVAALLMAICFSGLDRKETADLTLAMRDSGEVVDLSDMDGVVVDKHSTGGVGDTTTLITAPVVAACGLKVAKMSGRGLGHTGGTIDKLESIPGFNADIDMKRFKSIVRDSGLAIIGQTGELVPADRKLYALRDVTGTVDNISLIAASIMSKKLASGSDIIVLDVKTGNGAFMKEQSQAEELATVMVETGRDAGRKIMALVTDMNQPLGNAVGNSLEVKEAIEILQGKHRGDLRELSLRLAAQLVAAAGGADGVQAATGLVEQALESGAALERLARMIEAQGGDPQVCRDTSLLPEAEQKLSIRSPATGYLSEIVTGEVGMAAMLLGAGRTKKTDVIDPATGVWMSKRLGDFVKKDEEIAVFHVNDTKNLEQSERRFLSALVFSKKPPEKKALVYRTID
jgi:pyrimidine-nucleoside phosphorylase